MKIIGQEKLLSSLSQYTLQSLPKAMLFLGPEGCGKHSIAKQLALQLNVDYEELTDKVTQDQLIQFMQKPLHTVYIINLDNFIDTAQNQFLKFIEEPADTVHIVLLASSELAVLPTILNRCVKYTFEPYTVEQLRQFEWLVGTDVDEIVFKVCDTPGKLTCVDQDGIFKLKELCEKIVRTVHEKNFAATLLASLKFNYDEDYSKLDFMLFFSMLEIVSYNIFMTENFELAYRIFILTKEYKQLITKRLNKEYFMNVFLTALWERTR